MYKFQLTKKEEKMFDEWKKIQKTKTNEITTTGGRWSYTFTPTSIGIIVEGIDNATNEKIDLTDYDNW